MAKEHNQQALQQAASLVCRLERSSTKLGCGIWVLSRDLMSINVTFEEATTTNFKLTTYGPVFLFPHIFRVG